jgi:hypothetical protein
VAGRTYDRKQFHGSVPFAPGIPTNENFVGHSFALQLLPPPADLCQPIVELRHRS